MNVGDRQNTTIWSYPWVPNLDNFLLPHPLQYSGDVQLVADLIDHDALDQNYRLLCTLFPPQLVLANLSIPVAPIGISDSFIWHYTGNDQYNI